MMRVLAAIACLLLQSSDALVINGAFAQGHASRTTGLGMLAKKSAGGKVRRCKRKCAPACYSAVHCGLANHM